MIAIKSQKYKMYMTDPTEANIRYIRAREKKSNNKQKKNRKKETHNRYATTGTII